MLSGTPVNYVHAIFVQLDPVLLDAKLKAALAVVQWTKSLV
jgi:hypothetical protein